MSNQGFNQNPNYGGGNNQNQGFNQFEYNGYNGNVQGLSNPGQQFNQMIGQFANQNVSPNNNNNNNNNSQGQGQANPAASDPVSQQQEMINLQNQINAEHQKTVLLQQQAQI